MRNQATNYLLAATLCVASIDGIAAPASKSGAVQKADELFRDARSLMAQSHFAEACPKLVESQNLDAGVGTLLTLGECYEASGDFPAAITIFEEARDEAVRRNDPRIKLASDRIKKLLPKVAQIRLSPVGGNLDANTTITIDENRLASSSWDKSIPMAPGSHRIEARAEGKLSWSTVVTLEAGTAPVEVQIPELEAEPTAVNHPFQGGSDAQTLVAPAALPPVGPRLLPDTTNSQVDRQRVGDAGFRTQRVVAIAVGGLGIVGAGVGTWLLITGQSKEAESEKFCNSKDPSRCTQPGVDLIHEAQRRNTAGGIVLGVSVAALLGGTVLYVVGPAAGQEPPKTASGLDWQPMLLPHAAGISVKGRY